MNKHYLKFGFSVMSGTVFVAADGSILKIPADDNERYEISDEFLGRTIEYGDLWSEYDIARNVRLIDPEDELTELFSGDSVNGNKHCLTHYNAFRHDTVTFDPRGNCFEVGFGDAHRRIYVPELVELLP